MESEPDCAVHVINLAAESERLRFMHRQFESLGVELVRYPAVDARKLSEVEGLRYKERCGRKWSLNAAAIACFESHLRMWEVAADSSSPITFVAEDDIIVTSDLKKAMLVATRRSGDFDVIKMDTALQRRRYGRTMSLGKGFEGWEISQMHASSALYGITRTAARKMIKAATPYCDHLDDFLFRPRRNLKIFQLVSAVAIQGMFIADQDLVDLLPIAVAGSQRTRGRSINAETDRGPIVFTARANLLKSYELVEWQIRKMFSGRGGHYAKTRIPLSAAGFAIKSTFPDLPVV